jgi:hypothetical protein
METPLHKLGVRYKVVLYKRQRGPLQETVIEDLSENPAYGGQDLNIK